jgi:3-oxoacyl-[acyl-carrier protein] reductase
VVLNGLDDGSLESVATALKAEGGEVLAVPADVGQASGVDRLFDETARVFGAVDILVNNAAWAIPVSHFLEMDERHWDTVIRTNLKSVYLCSHRAANVMVDHGRGGSIISISSFGAPRAHRAMAAYDASKGGIEAFTRAISLDLAPFGIRVNAVGPGPIRTEAWETQPPETKARQEQTVPLGHAGRPADIAAAVAFLASDDASFITGQVLYVDGGVLAQLRSPQADSPLPQTVSARLPSKGQPAESDR